MEKIVIVDENDKIIGSKDRSKLTQHDIYRATSLWIEDKQGNVLLSKRALNKHNDPGKWMPAAVAGTVTEGESYKENVIKEAREELGLDLRKHAFKLNAKRFNNGPKHRYFSSKYIVVENIDINSLTLLADELAEVKWFSKKELKKLVEEKPEMFVSSMKDSLKVNGLL